MAFEARTGLWCAATACSLYFADNLTTGFGLVLFAVLATFSSNFGFTLVLALLEWIDVFGFVLPRTHAKIYI